MSTLTSAGLKKSFENKTVIHNVSLEVNSGEIVGLLGPNGAGKTTTFYMIVGLMKSDEGSIYINDQNITCEPIHKRFEQGISYLPQEPSVFRDMTAKDNIEAILEVDKNLNLIKGGGGAHTNEKRLAKIANKFICVVDESKIVETLGNFPLPVEIRTSHKEEVLLELKKYSENITVRDFLSDNKNYIFDIHNFKIAEPQKTEKDMLTINGVIDVGIFSENKPQIVIVGNESSYRLIES